jgi:hypothetical protein
VDRFEFDHRDFRFERSKGSRAALAWERCQPLRGSGARRLIGIRQPAGAQIAWERARRQRELGRRRPERRAAAWRAVLAVSRGTKAPGGSTIRSVSMPRFGDGLARLT